MSTFCVGVVGTGGVGKAFLGQLEALATRYRAHKSSPTHIDLVYVSRSTKALASPSYSALPFHSWEADLDRSSSKPFTPTELLEFLANVPTPRHPILVDNTASEVFTNTYPDFLRRGVSIVTSNKKAFAADLALWKAIFDAAANGSGDVKTGGYIFHESTVSSCLPVLSTLKELLETGDVVTRIEGVLSGTMSFLFNNFMPVDGMSSKSFSSILRTARELGYTEPDPRDDLNGMDVARKLTILARMVGIDVPSATTVNVQSLIPKGLETVGSVNDFMDRFDVYDANMDGIREEAAREGKVLRYAGSIDVSMRNIEISLQKFGTSHPIATLKSSESVINFYTKRYGTNPLIIKGEASGGEATAMGVTADIIRVMNISRYRARHEA